MRFVPLLTACLLVLAGCREPQSGPTSTRFSLALPVAIAVEPHRDLRALFDGDPRTAVDVDVPLQVSLRFATRRWLTSLKVHGAHSLTVSTLTSTGAASSNPGGWSSTELQDLEPRSELVLRLLPGKTGGRMGEIELWAESTRPAPRELLTLARAGGLPSGTHYDNLHVVTEGEAFELVPRGLGTGTDCRLLRFATEKLLVPRARSAQLLLRATGLARGVELSASLNGGYPQGGLWLGAVTGEGVVGRELPTHRLADGPQEVMLCLPPAAIHTVAVSSAQLVLTLHDGSVELDSASAVALGDALDGDQETVGLLRSGRHELRFHRPYVIDSARALLGSEFVQAALDVQAGESWRGSRPLALNRGWNTIELDAEALWALSLELEGVRPDVPAASLAELELQGSPSGAAREAPSLHIAYPPIALRAGLLVAEHFGDVAYLEGWARAEGQPAQVFVDDVRVDVADGVFSTPLRRQAGADLAPWTVRVVAVFQDGTRLERELHFSEDAAATLHPGQPASVSGEENARFGREGATTWGRLRSAAGGRVALGTDVAFEAPPGALRSDTRIGIHRERPEGVPPMDPGMLNVTAPVNGGYEFLPPGQTFDAPVKITLPYDAQLLPDGMGPEAIHSYYFDEDQQRWVRLQRKQLNRAKQQVVSETTHFTFMVNAVLVLPEHAGPSSFNPTSLSGIAAATPAANIDFISPPGASWDGAARVSFPIRLPPARGAHQPQLQLAYDSGAENGWLGVGWTLPHSRVSLDTRFGVPFYDGTAGYLLDGEQLVPVGDVGQVECVDGSPGLQYRKRVEGSFLRIVRCGPSAFEHRFEVTDKAGTLYLYGLTPAARLESPEPSGEVAEWHLERVIDANGNLTLYQYETDGRVAGASDFDDDNREAFRHLYLKRVRYSGRSARTGIDAVLAETPADTGIFEVELLHRDEPSRPDPIISGRYGFKTALRRRLGNIRVTMKAASSAASRRVVREYQLGYEVGDFGKSLLSWVGVYGEGGVDNGRKFYTHEFEWKKAVEEAGEHPFGEAPKEWRFDAPDQRGASFSVGGSSSRYSYVGLSGAPFRSIGAVGVSLTETRRGSRTESMLLDIDGDGRPDRVTKDNFTSLRVELNDGNRLSASEPNLELFPDAGWDGDFEPFPSNFGLGTELGQGFAVAVEANLGLLNATSGVAYNVTTARELLLDADGDGRVDFARDGVVHFNQARAGASANCEPWLFCFEPEKRVTELALSDLVSLEELNADPAILDARAARNEQLRPVDALLEWTAPYSGHVSIEGLLRWRPGRPAPVAGQDGVVVRVFHHQPLSDSDEELDTFALEAGTGQVALTVASFEVQQRDRLYFLLSTQADFPVGGDGGTQVPLEDVELLPVIQYEDCIACGTIGSQRDPEGGLAFTFDAKEDFRLAGGPIEPLLVPRSGKLRISGEVEKLTSTTAFRSCVQRFESGQQLRQRPCRSTDALLRRYGPTSRGTFAVGGELNVTEGQLLVFRVESELPEDPRRLTWAPSAVMTQLCNAKGVSCVAPTEEQLPEVTFAPQPFISVHSRSGVPLRPLVVPRDGRLIFESQGDSDTGEVVFSLRSRTASIFEHRNGSASDSIDISAGTELFAEAHSDTAQTSQWQLALLLEYPAPDGGVARMPLNISRYFTQDEDALDSLLQSPFGGGYRGFRYGVWMGKDGEPLEGKLFYEELTESFDGGTPEEQFADAKKKLRDGDSAQYKKTRLFAAMVPSRSGTASPSGEQGLFPQPAFVNSEGTAWFGPGGVAHAGRQGGATSGQGFSSAAFELEEVARTSEGVSVSAGISFGVGINLGLGSSSARLDVRDMNGDGVVDIVRAGPQGGIVITDITSPGVRHRYSADGGVALSENVDLSFGVGLGTGIPIRSQSATGETTGLTALLPNNSSLGAGLGGNLALGQAELTDVNGDGLPDQVRYDYAEGALFVRLNYGTRFARVEDRVPLTRWSLGRMTDGIAARLQEGLAGFSPFDEETDVGTNEAASLLQELARPDALRKQTALSLNANFGVAFGQDYGATVNVETSLTETQVMLTDVTGDGLPDYVRKVTGDSNLYVRLNLGYGFHPDELTWPMPDWPDAVPRPRFKLPPGLADLVVNEAFLQGGADGLEVSATHTEVSVGARFTVPIPTPIGFVLLGSGGTETPFRVSGTELAFTDINGDGLPDHVLKTQSTLPFLDVFNGTPALGERAVWVRVNRLAGGNLLSGITQPMDGHIALEYGREGNTAEDPRSRIVLSKVTVSDGRGEGTGHAVENRFEYRHGRYHREERLFLGFAEVRTTFADDSTQTSFFRNDSMRTRGLMSREERRSKNGALWHASIYEYHLPRFAGGAREECTANAPFFLSAIDFCTSSFEPLRRVETRWYEGGTTSLDGLAVRSAEEYEYDVHGNVTLALGLGDLADATDDSSARVEYLQTDAAASLSATGLPKRVTVHAGLEARTDALLRERSADFYPNGNLKTLSTWISGSDVATTSLIWNEDGRLTSITGPPNHAGQHYGITYQYDTVARSYPVHVSDSFGDVSTATYDFAHGVALEEVDLSGNTTIRQLDGFGRLEAVYGPYEPVAEQAPALQMFYSLRATPERPAFAKTSNRLDGDTTVDTYVYLDGLQRVLQTRRTAVVEGNTGFVASGLVTHDALGRVRSTSQPIFRRGAGFQPLSRNNPTKFSYDILGRPTVTEHPDGAKTQFQYALSALRTGGPLRLATTVTDPLGLTKRIFRDVRENTVAIEEEIKSRYPTTLYRYDAIDQLRSIEDAAGHTTTVDFDGAGRRTRLYNPDTGTQVSSYDLAGNLIAFSDENLRTLGVPIRYSYHFNRLKRVDRPLSADTEFFYGARGAPENGAGRLVRIIDEAGEETRGYGALGELTRTTRTVAPMLPGGRPQVFETRFEHDSFGRVRKITYPDGEVLTYGYDAGGLPVSATGRRGVRRSDEPLLETYVSNILYDEFGQRLRLELGNGVVSTYEYHPQNRRLTTLNTVAPGSPTPRLLQALSYVHDAAGNIKALTNALGDATEEGAGAVAYTFDYDELHRLEHSTGTAQARPGVSDFYESVFEYSDIHNLTRKMQVRKITDVTTGTPVVDKPEASNHDWAYQYSTARPHQLTQAGPSLFAHDANGNVSVQCLPGHFGCPGERVAGMPPEGLPRHRQLQWTEENWLRAVVDGGGQRGTRFVYDGSGQRVGKLGYGGESFTIGQFYSQRGRHFGTKHIFIGAQRIASNVMAVGNGIEPIGEVPSGLEGNVNGCEPSDGQPPKCPPVLSWPGAWSGNAAATSATYYYHPDHLGSTAWLTDQRGRVHERLEYFPYGEVWREDHELKQRGPKRRRPTYLFTGKEYDEETGLTYFGARYYDSRLVRWMSPDPAALRIVGRGIPGGLSTYAYASNSPVRFVDPDGEQAYELADATAAKREVFRAYLAARITPENTQAERVGLAIQTLSVELVWAASDFLYLGTEAGKASGSGAQGEEWVVPVLTEVRRFSDGFTLLGNPATRLAPKSALPSTPVAASPKTGAGATSAAKGLPDGALVCRGGTCTADRFATGSGITIDEAGKLQGVSVNSAPGKTVQELSATFPQKQVGVSTVGDVRAAGGDVFPSPTPSNPNHCTMCGITPQQAEGLFTPTIRNPNK